MVPRDEGALRHNAGIGYVHTITATAANVHDIDEAAKLIREDDEVMYGTSGYNGMAEHPEVVNDEHLSKMEYRTDVCPGSLKISNTYKGINREKVIENRKSSTCCKVEHLFLIVNRQVVSQSSVGVMRPFEVKT